MRSRVVLILISLGLAMAASAAPVAAGGGSLSIGNNGADGELGGGFSSNIGPWTPSPFCETGFHVIIPGVSSEEGRFALEFPLSGLPANATITSATLGVRSINGAQAGQTALYGYAGDGSITAADVQVTGTPILFSPVTATLEDHDVTSLVTAAVVSAGWAGFSFRQDPLVDFALWIWECPGNTANYPILTITYDLPNPAATQLPNAAMATPGPSSTMAALGFAVLLIGALGALAVVSSRRAVSRS